MLDRKSEIIANVSCGLDAQSFTNSLSDFQINIRTEINSRLLKVDLLARFTTEFAQYF